MDPFECAKAGNSKFFEEVDFNVLQNWRNQEGDTVLSIAARIGHLNCCQVIYQRCPQLLYETNKVKFSALHNAAYNGKDEVIKYLLCAAGAETQTEEDSGVVEEDIETGGKVKQYVDFKLLMMVGSGLETALHMASKRGKTQSTKLLLEADSSNKLLGMLSSAKCTPLHFAVQYNHLEIVRLLLERDPDFVYQSNKSGQTPFSISSEAATSGDPTSGMHP